MYLISCKLWTYLDLLSDLLVLVLLVFWVLELCNQCRLVDESAFYCFLYRCFQCARWYFLFGLLVDFVLYSSGLIHLLFTQKKQTNKQTKKQKNRSAFCSFVPLAMSVQLCKTRPREQWCGAVSFSFNLQVSSSPYNKIHENLFLLPMFF